MPNQTAPAATTPSLNSLSNKIIDQLVFNKTTATTTAPKFAAASSSPHSVTNSISPLNNNEMTITPNSASVSPRPAPQSKKGLIKAARLKVAQESLAKNLALSMLTDLKPSTISSPSPSASSHFPAAAKSTSSTPSSSLSPSIDLKSLLFPTPPLLMLPAPKFNTRSIHQTTVPSDLQIRYPVSSPILSALDTIDEDFAPSIKPAATLSSSFPPPSSLPSNFEIKHHAPDLTTLLTDFDLPSESSEAASASSEEQLTSSATSMTDDAPAESTTLLTEISPEEQEAFSADSISSPSATPTTASMFFDSWQKIKKVGSYITIFILMIALNAGGFLAISQIAPKAEAGNFPPEEAALEEVEPVRTLTFEGYLFNHKSVPITGNKNIQFSLYDSSGADSSLLFADSPNAAAEAKGNQLWNSTYCEVWVNEKGFFSVNLGAGQGHNKDYTNCGPSLGKVLEDNPEVWLQINIERETLNPRQRLKAVPLPDASEVNSSSQPTNPLEASKQFYFRPGYEEK